MITKTNAVRAYLGVAGLAALAVLFASLGAWQLERAAVSRATLGRFATGAEQAVLGRLPRSLDEPARFRRVELRGEFVGEPQFLLDNMLHDGIAGYHVLTALRVPGVHERVLVNRGWIAAGGDRRVLPDIAIASGARTVAGTLERLPRPGLRLGSAADGPGAAAPVVVLQYPTAEDLAHRLGAPVFDYQVLLDAAAADGYLREWRAPGVAPERHLAYAGQWWLLTVGAFAAAVVMAVRLARRRP